MCKIICRVLGSKSRTKKAKNVMSYFENLKNLKEYNQSFQAKIDRARLRSGKSLVVA